MVTVMAVLVGCGAKNDSESGSNSGSEIITRVQ